MEVSNSLASKVRHTESRLSNAQMEATEEILTILDRDNDSRLWRTEDGRLRCWLDIAETFIRKGDIIKEMEHGQVDMDIDNDDENE